MTNIDLNQYLGLYISNPHNAEICFNVALAYESLNQSSSALTFLLKALELSTDKQLQYECLLKIALIVGSSSNRDHTTQSTLYRAIALLPKRSEAYFLLGQLYERTGKWYECYANACIALESSGYGKLISSFYVGETDALLFQKGLAAWWIGNCVESMSIMRFLNNHCKNEVYRNLSYNNSLNGPPQLKLKEVKYTDDFQSNLKYKFKGYKSVEKNYAESLQDMFVLMCTDGKKNGVFLEIGASKPYYNNNTFLLESQFNWTGFSIDFNESLAGEWSNRKSKFICKDARYIDWTSLLKLKNNSSNHIDYLQLDCEPPHVTLDILYKIPFDKCTFSVITFEHDYYTNLDNSVRLQSRNFLKSLGYELIIPNVSPDDFRPFEDWYIHPQYVTANIVSVLKQPDRPIHNVLNCVFNF